MGPLDAITTCFRKYADFSGRAPRPEFWWFVAFQVIAFLVAGTLDVVLFPDIARAEPPTVYPLSEVAGLALLLPTFAVAARRLHDTGTRSETALILLGLCTLLGYTFTVMDAFDLYAYTESVPLMVLSLGAAAVMIALLVYALKASQPEVNAWGPQPGFVS